MHTMNAAQVKAAFERESILPGREDLVPEDRAVALFGKEAVEYACHLNGIAAGGQYVNGYGVGGFTLIDSTFRGFQATASWHNVHLVRKEREVAG